MSVLKEVLKWSADRPAWQRDALRRLVETGEIVADDIPLLAEICKSSYGLVEPNPGNPLTAHHLPNEDASFAAKWGRMGAAHSKIPALLKKTIWNNINHHLKIKQELDHDR